MVILKCDNVTAEIHQLGAELRKLTKGNEDLLWSGDHEVWSGVAPILFPICGGLKGGKYTLDGKEYSLAKHGFARNTSFELESANETDAVFVLRESEKTLSEFPRRFELRVRYTLTGDSLKAEYSVANNDTSPLYFSIGAHEGYSCPEGISNYEVIFPENESLDCYLLDGDLLTHTTERVIENSKVLPLEEHYLNGNCFVFKNLRSRLATLRNKQTGYERSVEFEGFDYFLMWNKPGAPYICLEPWAGIPAFNDDGIAFEQKEGMMCLDPGATKTLVHTLRF